MRYKLLGVFVASGSDVVLSMARGESRVKIIGKRQWSEEGTSECIRKVRTFYQQS